MSDRRNLQVKIIVGSAKKRAVVRNQTAHEVLPDAQLDFLLRLLDVQGYVPSREDTVCIEVIIPTIYRGVPTDRLKYTITTFRRDWRHPLLWVSADMTSHCLEDQSWDTIMRPIGSSKWNAKIDQQSASYSRTHHVKEYRQPDEVRKTAQHPVPLGRIFTPEYLKTLSSTLSFLGITLGDRDHNVRVHMESSASKTTPYIRKGKILCEENPEAKITMTVSCPDAYLMGIRGCTLTFLNEALLHTSPSEMRVLDDLWLP